MPKSRKSQLLYTIGDRVIISAVTTMGYDQENNRLSYRTEFTKPQDSIIVGAVRRQLGEYRKGYGSGSWDGEYEASPPELTVTGTIFLYQCRSSMTARIVDVAPEDIKLKENDA